jgi:hypothetical protein
MFDQSLPDVIVKLYNNNSEIENEINPTQSLSPAIKIDKEIEINEALQLYLKFEDKDYPTANEDIGEVYVTFDDLKGQNITKPITLRNTKGQISSVKLHLKPSKP